MALPLSYLIELAQFCMTMRHGVAYPETFRVVPYFGNLLGFLFSLLFVWGHKCSRDSLDGVRFICRSLYTKFCL